MSTQISQFSARSLAATRLRVRKYQLVREYGLPENAVGGSLSKTHRSCGKLSCRCSGGEKHPQWALTSSYRGKRRVERIPEEWVEALEQEVLATQAYLDALKEVMAINVELLALTRAQAQEKKRRKKSKK